LPAGDYQVSVTDDNGCTTTATVTIQAANNSLSVQIDNFTHVTCYGQTDGSATVTVTSGTSPYTYLWNDANAQTTETATNLPASDYQVSVTDSDGCTTTATVTIQGPNNSLSVQIDNFTHITCYGQTDGSATVSATGGTSPYMYLWNDANAQTTETATNLSAGDYQVSVTDGNGCTTTATVTISQPEELLLSVTTNKTSVCAGELAELSATSTGGILPHTISWNGISTAWSFSSSITQDTVFIATVTDSNGCTTSAQISISVSELPIALFDDSPRSVCLGSQITFSNLSTGNFTSCEWTFSDSTQINDCGAITYTANTIGDHDLTLTIYNADGCKASYTGVGVLNVLESPTAAFITDKTEYNLLENEVSFLNLSQNASNYLWDFGDSSEFSDAMNPRHEYPYTHAGNYVITLIAMNGASGCSDTVQQVIVIKESEIFYIANAFTPDGNGLNELFLPVITAGIDPKFYEFDIYNRWGERIFTSENIYEGWDGTFKGEKVKVGVYTWKIRLQHQTSAKRKEFTGIVNVLW